MVTPDCDQEGREVTRQKVAVEEGAGDGDSETDSDCRADNPAPPPVLSCRSHDDFLRLARWLSNAACPQGHPLRRGQHEQPCGCPRTALAAPGYRPSLGSGPSSAQPQRHLLAGTKRWKSVPALQRGGKETRLRVIQLGGMLMPACRCSCAGVADAAAAVTVMVVLHPLAGANGPVSYWSLLVPGSAQLFMK